MASSIRSLVSPEALTAGGLLLTILGVADVVRGNGWVALAAGLRMLAAAAKRRR